MRGPDQPEVALVDQIGQRHALVLVLLGDGDDEAEVRADQLVERFGIARADVLRETDFLGPIDQRICADLLQVLIEGPFPEGGTPRGERHQIEEGSAVGPASVRIGRPEIFCRARNMRPSIHDRGVRADAQPPRPPSV
jgi:hypothetical protein